MTVRVMHELTVHGGYRRWCIMSRTPDEVLVGWILGADCLPNNRVYEGLPTIPVG